jgi:hypothetical protein
MIDYVALFIAIGNYVMPSMKINKYFFPLKFKTTNEELYSEI